MVVLGSAAAGSAQALDAAGVAPEVDSTTGAGMGHPPGIDKTRRSQSEGGRYRSRSPGGRPYRRGEGTRTPSAECAATAPVFIEPGTEEAGVKSNAHRVFDYLAHLEKVVNEHAGLLDNLDVGEELLRGHLDNQPIDVANAKAIIEGNDAEFKRALEFNGAKLKENMATSVQALWDFLAHD